MQKLSSGSFCTSSSFSLIMKPVIFCGSSSSPFIIFPIGLWQFVTESMVWSPANSSPLFHSKTDNLESKTDSWSFEYGFCRATFLFNFVVVIDLVVTFLSILVVCDWSSSFSWLFNICLEKNMFTTSTSIHRCNNVILFLNTCGRCTCIFNLFCFP